MKKKSNKKIVKSQSNILLAINKLKKRSSLVIRDKKVKKYFVLSCFSVEELEIPIDAVFREFLEETSLLFQIDRELLVFNCEYDPRNNHIF